MPRVAAVAKKTVATPPPTEPPTVVTSNTGRVIRPASFFDPDAVKENRDQSLRLIVKQRIEKAPSTPFKKKKTNLVNGQASSTSQENPPSQQKKLPEEGACNTAESEEARRLALLLEPAVLPPTDTAQSPEKQTAKKKAPMAKPSKSKTPPAPPTTTTKPKIQSKASTSPPKKAEPAASIQPNPAPKKGRWGTNYVKKADRIMMKKTPPQQQQQQSSSASSNKAVLAAPSSKSTSPVSPSALGSKRPRSPSPAKDLKPQEKAKQANDAQSPPLKTQRSEHAPCAASSAQNASPPSHMTTQTTYEEPTATSIAVHRYIDKFTDKIGIAFSLVYATTTATHWSPTEHHQHSSLEKRSEPILHGFLFRDGSCATIDPLSRVVYINPQRHRMVIHSVTGKITVPERLEPKIRALLWARDTLITFERKEKKKKSVGAATTTSTTTKQRTPMPRAKKSSGEHLPPLSPPAPLQEKESGEEQEEEVHTAEVSWTFNGDAQQFTQPFYIQQEQQKEQQVGGGGQSEQREGNALAAGQHRSRPLPDDHPPFLCPSATTFSHNSNIGINNKETEAEGGSRPRLQEAPMFLIAANPAIGRQIFASAAAAHTTNEKRIERVFFLSRRSTPYPESTYYASDS